jgi:hypothetical protein
MLPFRAAKPLSKDKEKKANEAKVEKQKAEERAGRESQVTD